MIMWHMITRIGINIITSGTHKRQKAMDRRQFFQAGQSPDLLNTNGCVSVDPNRHTNITMLPIQGYMQSTVCMLFLVTWNCSYKMPCDPFYQNGLTLIPAWICNYANPVYGVDTICHQVRCLRWGHPSPFHTAMSLLIWYKMFCMTDISYKIIGMKFINMLSVYAQPGTHRRFDWWIIAILT